MLYESELKVLEILWRDGDVTAKDLGIELKASESWAKTTSYTVIGKCLDKGLIKRLGNNFTCRATITQTEAQMRELEILAEKMFGGSMTLLAASASLINDEQSCKLCGCTDFNCSQCVERTGTPCYWVEDDLCSACSN